LKIFRGLQTRQPTNTSWQAEVGYAHNNLGTLALRQGRLGDAVAAFRDDQQIKAAIVAGAHDNRQAQEDLLVSNAILGRTLALCGDLAGALRYTQAAVDSAKRLVAYDTANVYWQEFLGLYSQQLGGLLRQRGRIAEATSADRKAIRILKGLAAKDPTYADYEQELAQGRLEWAQLQLLQGKEQQAAQTANSSLVSLQALQVKTPGDESLVLLVAKAHILLGRTVTLQHDLDASRRHWLQARDALAPMARSGSDPRQLAAYAEALLRLGDVDQAGPFLARLAAMGYSEPDFVALVSGAKLEYPVNAAVMQRIAGPQENVDARP
jgi:tetratricopeptide (TPR) repeat protein